MIKKILLIVLTALFVSLCLFFSLSSYIRYRQDYVSIWVASHQLAQRTMITDEDLKQIKLPKQVLNDQFYLEKDDMKGKYVKMAHTIPAGSLIYKSSLESDIKDKAYTLLYDSQASYDLYCNEIRINTASLTDNMYIDIYLTLTDNNKPVSDLLIKNCRIIGMYDNNGKQIFSYNQDSRPYIISVAVEESDITILNKALKIGEVSALVSNKCYETQLRSALHKESEVLEYLMNDKI